MKRNLLPLIILLYAVHCPYSQEVEKNGFEFKLNYGSFGGGVNYFSKEYFSDDYDFELSGSLINFFIEHDKTNIGLEISPLKYTANYSVSNQEWNDNLSFLNGNLYWNPLDKKNIILGPFASISYLNIENWSRFNPDGYVFSSGLRFLLRTYIEPEQPFQIIGSEIGYRNISGKNSFYFNVNFDIYVFASLMMIYVSSMYGSGK